MTAATTYGTGRLVPAPLAPLRATAPVSALRVAAVATGAHPSAVPTLRKLVRHTARHWSLPEPAVDALALIASELVTNAVIHSGSPEVQLLLTADRDHAAVHVRDHGRWHEADHYPDAVPTGGRGLQMVRAYSDLLLVRSPCGTTATARLALNPPATETP